MSDSCKIRVTSQAVSDHALDARTVLAALSSPPDIEAAGGIGNDSKIADLDGELHLLLLRADGTLTLVFDEYRDLVPD